MERTKNVSKNEISTQTIKPIIMGEEKFRWKKLGGGSLRLKGRIIKPGEVFLATMSEIPNAFRNSVQCLDTLPSVGVKLPSEINAVKTTFTIKPSEKSKIEPHGKSKVWFDVINSEGVVLNEKGISKEDAKNLLGFDIVNQEGKILNEKSLTKERADELLKALEA